MLQYESPGLPGEEKGVCGGTASPGITFIPSHFSRPQAQRSRTQSCYFHGNN